MRVMLVYPNDRMDNLIPIGISILSSHLKIVGHKVKLYDTTFIDDGKEIGDYFREERLQIIPKRLSDFGITRIKMTKEALQTNFREAVEDYKPGLIGFSALEITYDQTKNLLEAVKDYPAHKIVGGIYPTFAPRLVIREPFVDSICEGEGEEALVDLVNALESGGELRTIPNITIKINDKVYRSSKIPSPLNDLGNGDFMNAHRIGLRRPLLPLSKTLPPDYSIYHSNRFFKPMGGKLVRTVAMELSRGCPFHCTFCCVPMQQLQHKSATDARSALNINDSVKDIFRREKPIDQFINEVKQAMNNYNLNFIYFADECFLAMSNERFKEFIDKYKEIKLPFFMETRVETIRPGYAKALEEAGCAGVAMGVESGSHEIRRKYLERMMPDDVIIDGFKAFEKTNIRVSANNIIGFPFEAREDIMKTIEINRQICPDNIVVNAFRPYSGTPLRELCIREGLIKAEMRAEDNRSDEIYYNGIMSAEEIEGLRKCFPLYVKFPKERWSEIRMAEANPHIFKSLAQEFKDKYLYRNTNFSKIQDAIQIFDDASAS